MPVAAPLLDVLPPKASGNAQVKRRIVYLDQNVVSMIAKSVLGRTLPGELEEPIEQLRAALRLSVGERQTARCVESVFHRSESSALVLGERTREGGGALFDEIARFVTYYSFGLWISPGIEMIQVQSALAVALERGIELPPRASRWRPVLSRDPQETNESPGTIRYGSALFVLGVEWQPRLVEVRPWAHRVTEMRAAGDFPSYDAALARAEVERRESAVKANKYYSWINRLGMNWHHGTPREPMDEFIASDRFFATPYLFAETRLYANVLSEPVRRYKDNDVTDIKILAAAVPYCDLVITDSYMAAAARQRGLDRAFDTKIVAASPDGLRDAAAYLSQ